MTAIEVRHDSDCAMHNEPAYPNGPCDCTQATTPAEAVAVGTTEGREPNNPDAKATEVVVPREPTDEMIAVAEQASQMLEWQIRASWSAMISTAEQSAPPAEAGSGGQAAKVSGSTGRLE